MFGAVTLLCCLQPGAEAVCTCGALLCAVLTHTCPCLVLPCYRSEDHPDGHGEESACVWLLGRGSPPQLCGRPAHGSGLVLALRSVHFQRHGLLALLGVDLLAQLHV